MQFAAGLALHSVCDSFELLDVNRSIAMSSADPMKTTFGADGGRYPARHWSAAGARRRRRATEGGSSRPLTRL